MLCPRPDITSQVMHHSPDPLKESHDSRQLYSAEYATELVVRRVGSAAENPHVFFLLNTGLMRG